MNTFMKMHSESIIQKSDGGNRTRYCVSRHLASFELNNYTPMFFLVTLPIRIFTYSIMFLICLENPSQIHLDGQYSLETAITEQNAAEVAAGAQVAASQAKYFGEPI